MRVIDEPEAIVEAIFDFYENRGFQPSRAEQHLPPPFFSFWPLPPLLRITDDGQGPRTRNEAYGDDGAAVGGDDSAAGAGAALVRQLEAAPEAGVEDLLARLALELPRPAPGGDDDPHRPLLRNLQRPIRRPRPRRAEQHGQAGHGPRTDPTRRAAADGGAPGRDGDLRLGARERGVALCPTLAAGDAVAQYRGWNGSTATKRSHLTTGPPICAW